jgi:hypothetical protein
MNGQHGAKGKCQHIQIKYYITQTYNIFKEDMENYNWVMFTHAMDFFKEHVSLKKPIPKQFFTSLLNNLLIEDLITLGNLLST